MAAVNHPSFDPHLVEQKITKYLRNKNEPLKNRALQGLYKPGSIFKIITAAAALETGIDIDHIFPVECRGAINYSEKTFWCWRRHNRVDSLQAALDTSCNIGMAEVGFALGPDRLFEYSNKFGFGAPLPLAFESSVMELNYPVASSRAPMVSDIRFDLADRACGLGEDILISPLHAAMLAAAVANQGRMMQPYFVKEIKNVQGKILGQGVPVVWRTPILPETAEKLKAFMVDAVLHGIGQKARIPGIVVAGKTGTTGDSKLGLNGWMICFAPADNPQVALAVYAEKEGTGMDMAAPIAKSFMEAVLKK
jgi:peptidoglycan glycosyltransferase